MKSTLQKLFSRMFVALNKPTSATAKNESGNGAGSFVRDGKSNFSVTLLSAQLYAFFGFIQKNNASIYGQSQNQKNRFKVNAISALALLVFFGTNVMNGQTSIPNTNAITQNFDSMGSSTTLPTNWRIHASTSSPSWASAATAVTQQASSGAPTTGGTYNFGSSSSERSIGAMSSGSFASPSNLLGFFQNTNAANLISLTVSYEAERYRVNSAAASVQFYYSTNGSTWTAVTAGDVATSSFPTGSSAYNFTSGTVVSKSNIAITGLNIATNGAIYLRWNINTTGTNSQGIAIDDISIVAGFQASNPTITGAATATAFTTTYGTASTAQNFTVSGTNLTANLVATAPTGFEVSSNGTTYGSTATFTQSSGSASGTLRIRLAATAAVGTYNSKTITLTSTGATTVNINSSSSGNTVSAKGLTITGLSGVNREYNGTTSATLSGTAAYSGLANGESFTVTGTPLASFLSKNAANGKVITVTGYTAPSSNYTVSQPSGITANVTPKELTVSDITADNKTYDGTVSATLSGTLDGVIAPDNVLLNATGEFENNFQTIFFGTPANIVNLSFALSGSDVNNYSLTQPVVNDLTADIFPKELTVSNATASDKVFDGTTDAVVSGTLNGVVSGDVVNLISSGVFASSAIGANIAVTPSWSIDGDTFNYTLTEPIVSLTANITSPGAPIITSATTASATYGDLATSYFITTNMAVDSYNATGLPDGLTINTATGEITGSPTAAGIFTVMLSAILGSETGFATLTYTINSINLTLSNPSSSNKPYDGNTNATITGTLTGAISGDDVSFDGAGIFDVASVGTNIFVTSAITLTGAQAANYTLTQPSGLSAAITQKPLIVTATANDKVYAGSASTAAVVTVDTVDGVVGSELVTVNASGAFANGNVGNAKNVTVTYSLSGADASNYSVVSPVILTADITPKPLTYTATANNKSFDGNTNATITVSNIVGVVSPDVVTITGTGTFASSAVGNGIVVSNVNLTLGGAQSSNYSITQPGNLTANITSGPTVLTAGDIAIIGYNTSGSPDTFAIMTLKDLSAGTQFFVNDNEMATPTSTTFADLNEFEASFTVKSGQSIPAGTVIVLPWGAAAVSTTTYDFSVTTGAGLGANNEEIYLYNASSISSSTPTSFIYYAKIGSTTSAIPSSLETSTTGSGTTAISPNGTALRYSTTGNIYNSCKQILLNEIGKMANWNATGASSLASTDWAFTVQPTCPSPTVATTGSVAALTAVYGSASSNGTFNVSGSNLTNNITLTAPAGFQISLSPSSGFAGTLTITAVSGSVASTPVYVRLLATDLVGDYTGDISCTTIGGNTVDVTIPLSTVTQKPVTISGIFINNKVENLGDFSATISGTPILNGVISADNANVSVNSAAATAVFTQDNAGTNIPVTVSGYVLAGSAASNYSLTQPTGLTANITTVASPEITSALTFSSVYGTAIVSPYQITATTENASFPVTAYDATNLPAGLTFDSATQTIIGTPTAAPGNYSVTISATNAGGTTNAFLSYTITKKEITVTATVVNKIYDSNANAAITVDAVSGVVGSDDATVIGGGLFDTENVGTAINVSANLALSGTQAANYSLTQPTGLSADITPFALTLTGVAAQNKVFDGNNAATITATLVGVFAGDTVAFNGTGTFASSAVGNAIAVTSTATLTGSDATNYSFVQPTGLTANITEPVLYANAFTGASACPTNGNIPTMAANATGAALTRNSITCMSTGNVFNSTTLNTTAAASNTSYIEFSASATAGYQLNVKSLSFFRQASNSAPNQLEIRYSTDGFATSTTMEATPVSPTTGTVLTWDFPDFNTPTAGTVAFRLYPYGTQRADNAGTSAASGTFRVDDVTIYGMVVTAPPAATLALNGAGTVCSGSNSSVKVDVTGGVSPYTVVYQNQTTNETFTVNNYVSGSPIAVSPAASGNNVYSLVSVTDTNNLASTLSGTAVVTVGSNNTVALSSAAGTDSQTVCSNTPITTITYTTTGATGAIFSGLPAGLSGSWSNNVATISGSPTESGTYTINLVGGCGTVSTTGEIAITSQLQWFLDADGDHYYTGSGVASCTSPGAGYTTSVLGGGDCDDSNNTMYPGAVEICYNNILENCTGTMSQGCAPVVVNMTPSYHNTTLASLSQAIPAVAYTYPGTSNIKYRFSITNVTTNTTAPDIIQTSRFVTIPASIHSYNAQYTIKASAVINEEIVAFAGNTITVSSPSVQVVTLSSASCGATLASLTSTLTANQGLNATGYTFRIRLNDANPTPAYAFSQSATRFIGANTFTGFPLQYATSYKVSVQYTFNDPVTNLPVQSGYGAECTVNTPSIPLTTMASPACGSQVTTLNANMSAAAASYATGYQFRIRLFADNGPTPTYFTTPVINSRFSSLTAFQGITMAYNTEYSISVQYSILNGSTTVWSGYGAECKVTTPFFPTTSLVPSQCGQSTPTSLTQQLNITPYPGFPNYRVKLEEVSGEDITNSQEIIISYPYFRLNQFSIAQSGKNYNVSVAIKLNGVFGDYSSACDLFTATNGDGNNEGGGIVKTMVPFKATAYPNPFANNFMLDVKSSSQSNVTIRVYDMIGRMIEQKEVRVSDMETTTIGEQYPTGVYNVVVSQQDKVQTVRVVKR